MLIYVLIIFLQRGCYYALPEGRGSFAEDNSIHYGSFNMQRPVLLNCIQ
jgi:hypothetical protein